MAKKLTNLQTEFLELCVFKAFELSQVFSEPILS